MINTDASVLSQRPTGRKNRSYMYKKAPDVMIWPYLCLLSWHTETTRSDDKWIIGLITAGYLLSNEVETYDSGIVKLPVARLSWLTKPWRNRRPDFSPISAQMNPVSVSSFCLKGHMFHGTAFWEYIKGIVHPNWNLHFLTPHGVPSPTAYDSHLSNRLLQYIH